ncbi:MAG: hypothetical protein ACSLEW_02325 [Nocardioides sp.]
MDDIVKRLKPGPHQLDAQESAERLAGVMAHGPRQAQRKRLALAAVGTVVALGIGAGVAFGVAEDDDPDRGDDPGSAGSVVEGECTPLLRLQGTAYVAVGYLENQGPAATRVGQAELGACDDEGPNGQGGYFPETPDTVPAYAFSGQPVARVVGIDFPNGYEVYVAEGVPSAEAQDILQALKSVK